MSAEQLAEDRDSLYAALNVPRTASAEDVKRSYRSLAQIYHPDKHTDPELKTRAIASFTRLQAAYEVLLRLSKSSQHPARHAAATIPRNMAGAGG